MSKRGALRTVVQIRRALGVKKRGAKPAAQPPKKPRKPVAKISAFPQRSQLVLRFLIRQADLIPGVQALYWRIRRNPILYEPPALASPNMKIKLEPIMRVTGNWALDRELERNVFQLNHLSQKARVLQQKINANPAADRKGWLSGRQRLVLENGSKLVRRNRQILIEFLYPNRP